MNKEIRILQEKEYTNEYGVVIKRQLQELDWILSNGEKRPVEYRLTEQINERQCFFRTFNRLGNAKRYIEENDFFKGDR